MCACVRVFVLFTCQDVDALSFRDPLDHEVGGAGVGHLAPLQGLFQNLLLGVKGTL